MDSLPPKTHNQPKRSIIGEWYYQRDEWMRELSENTDVSIMARLVGIHVALRINRGKRVAEHKQATIAKQLGITEQTVKKALRELRKHELIHVDQIRAGPRNRAVNHYSLKYAWERY